jgi:hypothetical protein
MKYHPTREAAQERAAVIAADPRVALTAVQMEPYNGWVVVVVPALYLLEDLAEEVDVQDGRPRQAPAKHRPVQPRTAPSSPRSAGAAGEAPQAPAKGATARVWAIGDGIGKADRTAIIAACVAEGINASTAATQYSKWKKARGF